MKVVVTFFIVLALFSWSIETLPSYVGNVGTTLVIAFMLTTVYYIVNHFNNKQE